MGFPGLSLVSSENFPPLTVPSDFSALVKLLFFSEIFGWTSAILRCYWTGLCRLFRNCLCCPHSVHDANNWLGPWETPPLPDLNTHHLCVEMRPLRAVLPTVSLSVSVHCDHQAAQHQHFLFTHDFTLFFSSVALNEIFNFWNHPNFIY